jgi:phosphate transport system protein
MAEEDRHMAQHQGHTVKAFDDELRQLRGLISEMGGLAEQQIIAAIDALTKRDSETAAKIVAQDKAIDAIETEAERFAVRIIALRAPMADDLREVIAALKISSVLERIGDYAKNIAKRTGVLAGSSLIQPVSILPEMGRIVARMVRDVLDAFVNRDAELAVDVCQRDKQVDDFYNSLFRTLLTYMMENPHHITASTHLLFIAKNLERIGDHATNVAEMVHYGVTGEHIGERPKADATPYVDIAPGQADG